MPNEKQAKTANPAIVAVEGPVDREPSLADMARARKGAPGERIDRANARRGDSRSDVDKWPDGVGGAGNHEDLPERLQAALRRLVQQYSTESESTRRQEVRRIKQAHQFWRGLHYLWWNERDQNWHLPFEQKLTDNSSLEDLPRYEFVTNIYQAFGLSLVAVLSQRCAASAIFSVVGTG